MLQYKVLSPIAIPVGTLVGLTDEMALPRIHNLLEHVAGVYAARTALSFKAGQEIGLDAGTAKALASLLQSLDEPVDVVAPAVVIEQVKVADPVKVKKNAKK